MIFQRTWQAVIEGRKTQTRRLVKPNECLRCIEHAFGGYKPLGVVAEPHFRYKIGQTYAVQPGRGQPAVWWRERDGEIEYAHTALFEQDALFIEEYGAIDPATTYWEYAEGETHILERMEFQPARIRITGIRREDVRQISEADAKAEAFGGIIPFLQTWHAMHDPKVRIVPYFYEDMCLYLLPNKSQACMKFSAIKGYHDAYFPQHAARYDAWALTFELVDVHSEISAQTQLSQEI